MLDGICLSLSLEIVLAIFGIYVPNMQDGDVYVTARTTVKWFLPLQYKFLTVAFEMVKCAECNMHHPLSYVDLNFLQKDVTTHILMRKKIRTNSIYIFWWRRRVSKPWRGRDTDEPEFLLHFANLISFFVVAVRCEWPWTDCRYSICTQINHERRENRFGDGTTILPKGKTD